MKQLCYALLTGTAALMLAGCPYALAAAGPANVTSHLCGAVGNGVADDTAALQTCIDYAKAHHLSVYLPSGKYKVTRSLNATLADGLYVRGDGADSFGDSGTTLLDALTEPYAVIDFSGCQECGIEKLTIATEWSQGHKRIYTGTASTSGVLVSPGPSQPVSGGFHFLLRDVDVEGTGMCAGCASVVIAASDWPVIQNYMGGPVVLGYSLGRSTAVKSRFYDIRKAVPGGSVTMDSIEHAQFSGDYVPGLQLTGSQYYVITDIDVSTTGQGRAGTMVEISGQTANAIHAVGLRTENFSDNNVAGLCKSGASPVPAGCGVNSVTVSSGPFSSGRSTGGSISGQFCGDPLGHVLHVGTGVWFLGDTFADYCEAMPLFLIDKGAHIWNDNFTPGQGLTSIGTINPSADWQHSNVIVPHWERFDVQKAAKTFPWNATGTFGSVQIGHCCDSK